MPAKSPTEAPESTDSAESIPAAHYGPQPAMTSATRHGTGDTSPAEPKERAYADDERVCVTLGFGANDLNSQGFSVGVATGPDGKKAVLIDFNKKRIAHGVMYVNARAVQRAYPDGVVRIHPNDATEADIARRCGIRPGEPAKVAAMLLASNLDEIAKQISPDELEMLARKLRDLSIERNAKHG